LVPLEAFVHGVPVIASRSGAIPEVVLDGECGLLFDENDSGMMADTARRLLTDPALHRRLSEGALKRIRDLSARNSAQNTLAIYQGLLHPEATVP
jgi:glycosyltransferase involved in cell wall biosynthesis